MIFANLFFIFFTSKPKKYTFWYLFPLWTLGGLFFSCEISQKGKWTENDKKKIVNNCIKDLKNTFDNDTKAQYLDITEKEIKNICHCAFKKIEKDFLPKKYTQQDIMPISQKCFADEIFGQKGNWKIKFKKNYTNLVKKEMGIKDEPTTEEMVLLQCFMAKYEEEIDIERLSDMNYVNTHTKRLMENCVKELGD